MYFLRCGIRCANADLFFAAYQKASLTTFINNNINYQVISSFELYLIKCSPLPVKKYLDQILFQRIKSHNSWDSCSEGLDYRLEEKNRQFKQNLYTDDPTMDDWIISMSNNQKIETMRKNATIDYKFSVETPQPGAPDYEKKIQYCRIQLRSLEYFDYDAASDLKNIDGVSLDKDSLKFEETAKAMKKEYLVNVVKSIKMKIIKE